MNGLCKKHATMIKIEVEFSQGLFIPQKELHVNEGNEDVVAFTDGTCSNGAVTGLR